DVVAARSAYQQAVRRRNRLLLLWSLPLAWMLALVFVLSWFPDLLSGSFWTGPDRRPPGTDAGAADITPGMRHVIVKVPAEGGIGGLLQPGAHVDVVHTPRPGHDSETKLLLQDVPVRAVRKYGADQMLVTLEVSPQQALVLIPAKDTGEIGLLLRKA